METLPSQTTAHGIAKAINKEMKIWKFWSPPTLKMEMLWSSGDPRSFASEDLANQVERAPCSVPPSTKITPRANRSDRTSVNSESQRSHFASARPAEGECCAR